MNPILQALNTGYKAKDILDYLSKMDPGLASKIALGLSAGHTVEDILRYVYRGGKRISQFLPDETKDTGNEFEDAIYKVHPGAKNIGKSALAVGGAALAGNALKNYLTSDATSNILPSGDQTQIESQTQQAPLQIPQQTDQLQQGMQQQAIQRATGVGIPQSTQQIATQAAMQPQAAVPSPAQPSPIVPQGKPALQLVQEANLLPHIQSLQKNIKDPKAIAGVLYNQFPQEMKKLQQKAGKPMEDVIAEALQGMPIENTPVNPPDEQLNTPSVEEIKPLPKERPLEKIEEPEEKPLGIGSQVITPSGEIGEIERISGKTAQIKTDSGKVGSPLDKVIEAPEEYHDVLSHYEKLIASIPEDQRSAVLDYMGYDPERKKLALRFHTGKQYAYENIPEDIAEKIANAMHTARTEGGNIYGAWSPGEASRGSGVYDLIKELQSKYGKGQEYTAKFDTLYDYFALPKQLLADKEKKRKDEERARKKAKKPIK